MNYVLQVYPTPIQHEEPDATEVDPSTRTLSAFLRHLRSEGYDEQAVRGADDETG
eukprot:COSAG01_NODE_5392_length_4291_cov_1.962071_2_plen_55_part_00